MKLSRVLVRSELARKRILRATRARCKLHQSIRVLLDNSLMLLGFVCTYKPNKPQGT